MSAHPPKVVETFELTARMMTEDDLDLLHELSIGVGWPHRAEDLRLLMELGQGLVACDPIDRVVGSAMWFPMGANYATIGMVITTPKLQSMGAGRWLMDHVLRLAGDGPRGLYATREAYKLYLLLGFEPVATIFQRQGICTAPDPTTPAPGIRLREVGQDEADTLVRLDRAAYGTDRAALIQRLLEFGDALVLERGGRPAGFSICQPFGRGHVIGPIVARDAADAIALTAPHAARQAGGFLRVDTAKNDPAFLAFLDSIGVVASDTVTRMKLGPALDSTDGLETWGLAFQALG